MQDLSLSFFRVVFELKMKKNMHYEIKELKMKPIADGKTLVYCKVKETYIPKEGYKSTDFLFPSGTVNEYLLVVKSLQFTQKITGVYPLFKKGDDGSLEKMPFPEEYRQYKNIENWTENDFLVEDISFSDFIAKQVAQRISRKVQEAQKEHESEKKKIQVKQEWRSSLGLLSDAKKEEMEQEAKLHEKTFHLDSVKANFEEKEVNGKDKLFKINMKFKQFPQDSKSLEDIKTLSLSIVKNVFNNYEYSDFSEVVISESTTGRLLGSYDQKTVYQAK